MGDGACPLPLGGGFAQACPSRCENMRGPKKTAETQAMSDCQKCIAVARLLGAVVNAANLVSERRWACCPHESSGAVRDAWRWRSRGIEEGLGRGTVEVACENEAPPEVSSSREGHRGARYPLRRRRE